MTDPKNNKPGELAENQLEEVSGGQTDQPVAHPMYFKYCAIDRTHVYPGILKACPTCGCKLFILEGEEEIRREEP